MKSLRSVLVKRVVVLFLILIVLAMLLGKAPLAQAGGDPNWENKVTQWCQQNGHAGSTLPAPNLVPETVINEDGVEIIVSYVQFPTTGWRCQSYSGEQVEIDETYMCQSLVGFDYVAFRENELDDYSWSCVSTTEPVPNLAPTAPEQTSAPAMEETTSTGTPTPETSVPSDTDTGIERLNVAPLPPIQSAQTKLFGWVILNDWQAFFFSILLPFVQ
jgi:hypothetical protein